MTLPNRPRSHRIEKESINKFESILPESFNYQRINDDYGIDGEVEIFGENGDTTGKKFLVQLKSTDEKEIKKALKVTLSISTYNYYKQLNVPILIAKYVSHNESIYARWIHSLNENNDSITKKNVIMRFNESDLITKGNTCKLLTSVDKFILFSSGKLDRKIKVTIDDERENLNGYNSGRFKLHVINKISNNNLIKLELTGNENADAFIIINEDTCTVSISDLSSVKFVVPKNNDIVDYFKFTSDIVLSFAFLLFNMNYTIKSDWLFDNSIRCSSLGRKSFFISSFIFNKIKINKVHDGLQYLIELIKDGYIKNHENIHEIQAWLILMQCSCDEINLDDVVYLSELLVGRYSLLFNGLDGSVYYNLANFLSSKNRLKISAKYYIKAAKSEPEYKSRLYWKKELAGVFFRLKKYNWSSMLYHSILQNEDSFSNKLLLVDSLFHSGNFDEASKLISSMPNLSDEYWYSELILIDISLDFIINKYGVKKQNINRFNRPFTQIDVDSALEFVTKENMLCPDRWFYLAKISFDDKKYTEAICGYLISFLSDPYYKETWINIIKCIFNSVELSNLLFVFTNVIGSRFGCDAILEVFTLLMEEKDIHGHNELDSIINLLIEDCEKKANAYKKNSVTVRLTDTNNKQYIYEKDNLLNSDQE
ncbi:DUF4365 domain-containing protein [Morganella morganii]|uniref:DUF4365 domain-containing protein n=1 Tax=Morganella morganii TaxID=582 RepID=UPI0032DB6082